MTFSITETMFGTLPTLTIEGRGARCILAPRGVTVLSWSVDGVELIDGYADQLEFTEQTGMRSAMMIPFSNRIAHGRYAFDGVEIDFHAGDDGHAGETVMHGLVRLADFTITGIVCDETFATVRLTSDALARGGLAGYPFKIGLDIDLTVTASGLDFTVTGTNLGHTAAPFATGWHPYFTIGEVPIQDLVVTIPAMTRIVSDTSLLPLVGRAAFETASGEYDYRSSRVLGHAMLDLAFSDLAQDHNGMSHSTMADPASGRTIDVWQERGLMHVFTADTVSRPRKSFAMEPVEVMTNAVNRPDQAETIRLEPGERRSFRFGATTTMEMS